jgi:hypothetical protein
MFVQYTWLSEMLLIAGENVDHKQILNSSHNEMTHPFETIGHRRTWVPSLEHVSHV